MQYEKILSSLCLTLEAVSCFVFQNALIQKRKKKPPGFWRNSKYDTAKSDFETTLNACWGGGEGESQESEEGEWTRVAVVVAWKNTTTYSGERARVAVVVA